MLKFVLFGLVMVMTLFYIFVMKPDTSYDGIWLTEGYDLLFDIKGGRLETYQVTGTDLVPFDALNGKVKSGVIETDLISLTLVKDGEGYIAQNSIGVEITRIHKGRSLKDYNVLEFSKDPFVNFDIFWQTFENNYPFFELYDVDWEKQKTHYRSQISKDTSTQDLFEIFKDMLKALNDDHIYISYGDEVFSPFEDLPQWQIEHQSKPLVEVIANHYIKDMKYSKDRFIRYGHLSEETGYILIATFGGYYSESESLEVISKAFQKALKSLKDTNRLILDLRFNRGGYDATGIKLAASLVSKRKLAYQREVKNGDLYTGPTNIYIEASDGFIYDKEIVILTSEATVSAAETFILSLYDLDNVMVIGEETSGHFSDMLERRLPNDITFGLSHMRYFAYDGTEMEGNKIQPEIHIPVDLESMKVNIDPALEWLLKNPNLGN